MRKKLSELFLKNLKPAPAGKRIDIMDTVAPRLGIRVTDTGHRSFIFVARFPGSSNQTRRRIGDYSTADGTAGITLELARKKAKQWDALLADGIDPAIEVKRESEQAIKKKRAAVENSFEARADVYLDTYCKNHRQARETARLLRKELLPAWKGRALDTITVHEVRELIGKIAQRSPSVARNTLVICKSFFGWACEQGFIDEGTSPAAGISPKRLIGKNEPRQRSLDDRELVAFWNATGKLDQVWRDLYRLLLLTGTRRSEIAELQWNEVDLDARELRIPPERHKSGSTHIVPLTDQAMDILAGLPRYAGAYVFSTMKGRVPVSGFSKTKDRLDKIMGVSDWTVHDLRRVVRSGLAKLKIEPIVAEMVLGHGRKGIERVYDQHNYSTEIRGALTMWANHVRDLVTPAPASPTNVVKMQKKVRRAS